MPNSEHPDYQTWNGYGKVGNRTEGDYVYDKPTIKLQ